VDATELLTKRLKDNTLLETGASNPQAHEKLVDSSKRLGAATKFLKFVEERVGSALREESRAFREGESLLLVQFGDEFGFSRDQSFLHLEGEGLSTYLTINTGNIVGQVRARIDEYDFQLRVTGRFGDKFLVHMIASAEGYLELEDLGSVPEGGDADWLLIYLWKIRLKRAFASGVPKLYIGKTERLPLVRGNIHLPAYLRLPTDVGRYTCNFREHSHDNEITRLINATFKQLLRRDVATNELLADTHRIRGAFLEACADHELDNKRRRPQRVLNPYFARYEEVRELSRKILRNESANVGSEDEEFSGLLFDISLLFEHYIRQLLLDAGLRLAPRIPGDAIKYPIDGRRRRGLLLDIVVHGPRGTLILDVKFKRWDDWLSSYDRSRSDLFQIMTYAGVYRRRYEATCPVFGYGFIFPVCSGEQEDIEERFQEFGLNYNVFFLHIPDDNRVRSFFEESILQNEKKFVDNIKQKLLWTEG
jgi:5-methylcytosine-specific restriction enzyme subunit McrC